MSRRLSKEDFDATFAAFLKTSISSEEDTEKINELLRNPKRAEPKNPGLWWINDEDKKKGASAKKSFLKSSKPLSSETPSKIKLSENVGGTAKLPKGAMIKGVGKSGKTDKAKSKGGKEPSPGKRGTTRGRGPTDVSMSKDSLEDISEKSEEHELHGHHVLVGLHDSTLETTHETTDDVFCGEDSDRRPNKPGFDTLDELAEKQKFFQDLESKANSTLDYSQLNRDLSQTGTTFSPGIAMKPQDFEDEDIVEGEEEEQNHLSHLDPQVDVEISSDKNSSQHKPSMLSKVSLLDSLDSTLNTSLSPQVPGKESTSRDTTQENFGLTLPENLKTQGTAGAMGTNTKEMEELQRVLREAGMSPTLKGPETSTMSGKECSRPVERSVGDILKEVDEIYQQQKAALAVEDNIKLMSDYKSPRSPRSAGISLQKQTNADDRGGFDNSISEDTEIHKPYSAAVIAERKGRKNSEKAQSRPTAGTRASEDQGKKLSKDRFSHIQSSGYGKRSPDTSPRRSQSRSSSLSPARPMARGKHPRSSSETTQHHSNKMMAGSPPPSPHHQKSEMRSAGQTQTPKTKYHSKPSLSQPEQMTLKPNMSSAQGGIGLFHEDVLIKELKDLREQYHEEREKNARLVAAAAAKEHEFAQKLESQQLDYEAHISDLKRDNFVISAKLKEYEASGMKHRGVVESGSSGRDIASDETIKRIEKECQEQEELLARFQAENKRLYEEIRSKEKAVKLTEEAMFKENQRLMAELVSVRSQLEQREVEWRSKGVITSLAAQQQISAGNTESGTEAARSTHLEEELKDAKRQHNNALRELKVLQQSHSELEQHVNALVMEREMLKKQLSEARQARPEDIKNLEQKHKEETERLTRKLKWYAENQELLDQSTRTIREKEGQIQELKSRIDELQSETGKRLEENKLRMKEKAADGKKIQDLQRQVKEMEQIIRRRHPNSLPALMMVAASSDDSSPSGDGRSWSVEVLEKRIKKLEGQLEKKDEETSTLLRAMEQKYNAVKFQFEERIADLESQLRMHTRPGDTELKPYEHPHTHALALERELESTRERCKRQVTELSAEVERLTAELMKMKKQYENEMRSEQARWLQVEAGLRAQIVALQTVKEKDKDLSNITPTAERLKPVSNGHKNTNKRLGKTIAREENYGNTVLNTFPESKHGMFKKEYQAEAFAEEHIADIIKENEKLKTKLELLQLEKDQERVNLRRSLAETESIARHTREDFENQLEAMRAAHEKELNKLRAEQALLHSSSKLAALQSRCDSQEVMLQHLQRQLAQREVEVEQMSALKKQETELKAQVETLQEKLREAKRTQTPVMRHYEALEEKISLLIEKHSKREQELEALVRSSQRLASQDLIQEAAHWKNMVEAKNLEINKFREELDSILEVLRELQRQGVKLPVGSLR